MLVAAQIVPLDKPVASFAQRLFAEKKGVTGEGRAGESLCCLCTDEQTSAITAPEKKWQGITTATLQRLTKLRSICGCVHWCSRVARSFSLSKTIVTSLRSRPELTSQFVLYREGRSSVVFMPIVRKQLSRAWALQCTSKSSLRRDDFRNAVSCILNIYVPCQRCAAVAG